jgi:putative transposase
MRKPRKLTPGARYHVVARANRREFIFSSDRIKELFLDVVRRAKKKYAFSVHNFCIMSNHIHFLIHPGPGESLSRIMQWILSVFASTFNRIFGYNGHVWYDRFKSVVIGTLRQYIATFQYIVANPVRAGIVSDPMNYQHTGIRHIRDGDYSVINPPDQLSHLLFPAVTTLVIASKPGSR